MHFVSFLYLRTYEVLHDTATNKDQPKVRQFTGPMMCAEINMKLVSGANNATIKELAIKESGLTDPEVMYTYPAYPEGNRFFDGKSNEGDWRVIFGHYYKPIEKDPNKPFVVQGDTSLEAKAKAREEALRPAAKLTPFVLVIPMSAKFMHDITISHLPQSAVISYDSSKQEIDPHLDEEMPSVPVDPFGLHVSEEKKDN